MTSRRPGGRRRQGRFEPGQAQLHTRRKSTCRRRARGSPTGMWRVSPDLPGNVQEMKATPRDFPECAASTMRNCLGKCPDAIAAATTWFDWFTTAVRPADQSSHRPRRHLSYLNIHRFLVEYPPVPGRMTVATARPSTPAYFAPCSCRADQRTRNAPVPNTRRAQRPEAASGKSRSLGRVSDHSA
jgi:hypothetical protein